MPRIPPALAALAASVAVIGVVVVLFVATGSGNGRKPPTCSAALKAGPYGCVVFESVSGTDRGTDQPWLANGTARYQVLGDAGRFSLAATGGCNTTTVAVTVSKSAYRTSGGAATTAIGCSAERQAHDDFIVALFTATAKVVEHDDATVTVTNGSRSAVFQEVIAQ